MTGRKRFAARPSNANAWIDAASDRPARDPTAEPYTARLTIDITPALRGQIKVAASNAAEPSPKSTALLAREFPDAGGAS